MSSNLESFYPVLYTVLCLLTVNFLGRDLRETAPLIGCGFSVLVYKMVINISKSDPLIGTRLYIISNVIEIAHWYLDGLSSLVAAHSEIMVLYSLILLSVVYFLIVSIRKEFESS